MRVVWTGRCFRCGHGWATEIQVLASYWDDYGCAGCLRMDRERSDHILSEAFTPAEWEALIAGI